MKGSYLPIILLLFCACSSPRSSDNNTADTSSGHSWTVPPVGTIVAADSIETSDDPLNKFYFSVALRVSKDNGQPGVYGTAYDVLASYGPIKAEGHMSMPRGGDNLRPLLKPDTSEESAYIIGFIPGPAYGGDSAFMPYYRVSTRRGEIAIKQIRGYSFQ